MPRGWVGIGAILSCATDARRHRTEVRLLDQAVDPGHAQPQDPAAVLHHRPPVVVPVRVVLAADRPEQLDQLLDRLVVACRRHR